MKQNKPNTKTDAGLVTRLVEFAEADSSWPISTSRRLLLEVVGSGGAVAVSDAAYEIRNWSLKQFDHFRANELRSFLRGLVATGSTDNAGSLVPEVRVTQLSIGAVLAGETVVMTVDGSARDVLWYQLTAILIRVGAGRVRRCKAPDCAKVFVKVSRGEYCSDRCQGRVYTRERRRRNQDKARKR